MQLDAESVKALQVYRKTGFYSQAPRVYIAIATWVASVPQFCDLVATGKLVEHLTELPGAFINVLTGDSTVHLWGPVLDAAHAVGAEIVVADRKASITKSRVAARLARADEAERDVSLDELIKLRMGSDAHALVVTAEMRARAQNGCLEPQKVKSAGYALIAEGATFGRVRYENLAAVRGCKNAIVQTVRDVKLIGAAPAVRAAGGVAPPAVATVTASRDPGSGHNSVAARTKNTERELLFARALQSPSAPGGDVVGIFDAGHMAGIARAWAGARSPEADALAAEYLRPVPSDAATAESYIRAPALPVVATLGVGAAAVAARKMLKSARPLRTAALLGVAMPLLPLAAFTLANRALGALVKADFYLRALDEQQLQFKEQEQREADAALARHQRASGELV